MEIVNYSVLMQSGSTLVYPITCWFSLHTGKFSLSLVHLSNRPACTLGLAILALGLIFILILSLGLAALCNVMSDIISYQLLHRNAWNPDFDQDRQTEGQTRPRVAANSNVAENCPELAIFTCLTISAPTRSYTSACECESIRRLILFTYEDHKTSTT